MYKDPFFTREFFMLTLIIFLQVAFQIVPGRMNPKYKSPDVRIFQAVNQLHGHLFVLPFSP